MEKVKIRKAKIKDLIFLEGEYTESLPGHSKMDSKFSRTVPVHQDLINAFAKLPRHLATLCDGQEDWTKEEAEKFTVKGFSIGGNDENETVSLSGAKEGSYGIINLNTPPQKWEASEYEDIGELGSDINACIYEVEQYLFEGKKAPDQQLEMAFEEDMDIANAEI